MGIKYQKKSTAKEARKKGERTTKIKNVGAGYHYENRKVK